MKLTLLLTICILFAVPCFAEDTIFTWDLSASEPYMHATNSGYRLYGRPASKTAFDSGDVLGTVAKGVNAITIAQPGLGDWIFAATAFSESAESIYSNEANKTFEIQPPTSFQFTVTAEIRIDVKPETVDTIKLMLAEFIPAKESPPKLE